MIYCSKGINHIRFQLNFGYNTRYNNSGHLDKFIVYVPFSHVYFRRQKFSFQTYMIRKTGAKKESICGAHVSNSAN